MGPATNYLVYLLNMPVYVNTTAGQAKVVPFGALHDPNNQQQTNVPYKVKDNQLLFGVPVPQLCGQHGDFSHNMSLYPGSADTVSLTIPANQSCPARPSMPYARDIVNITGRQPHVDEFTHGVTVAEDIRKIGKPVNGSAGNFSASSDITVLGNALTQKIPEGHLESVSRRVVKTYNDCVQGDGRAVRRAMNMSGWTDVCTTLSFPRNLTTLLVTLDHLVGKPLARQLLSDTEYGLIPTDLANRDQRYNHVCHLLATIALGACCFYLFVCLSE